MVVRHPSKASPEWQDCLLLVHCHNHHFRLSPSPGPGVAVDMQVLNPFGFATPRYRPSWVHLPWAIVTSPVRLQGETGRMVVTCAGGGQSLSRF